MGVMARCVTHGPTAAALATRLRAEGRDIFFLATCIRRREERERERERERGVTALGWWL
jgi:hypothetical protein